MHQPVAGDLKAFAGNSKTERLVKDGGKSCFGCHEAQKAKDYVFSETS